MKLKNKINIYKMAIVGLLTSSVIVISGVATLCGTLKPIKMQNEVYNEVCQTEGYKEYYKKNLSDLAQELVDEKISKEEFNDLENKINAEGYIKELPEQEKQYYEEKLKPANQLYNKLFTSGLSLVEIGLSEYLASFVLGLALKREEEKEILMD